MQNLQTLRRRIRSVQNTQKITRAMQMVAGAKLRRMQGELMSFKPYAQRLEQITNRFLAAHPDLKHPLLGNAVAASAKEPEESQEVAPIGLVVVSSDTGLCGTYNERLLGLAERFLLEHPPARLEAHLPGRASALLVAIGKKGNRTFARRGIARAQEILDWGGRTDPPKVNSVVDWMEALYRQGTVSSWWIAYTQFISALHWKPTVDQFLPLDRPAPAEFPEKIITESTPEAVAEECIRRSVKARFVWLLLEAFTAEHSARMIAMKNATDNAAEMIRHLTLVRNKARQAAITKELIEVVSGAEALK